MKQPRPRLRTAEVLLCDMAPGEPVAVVNLGCVRNLTDSQEILGELQAMAAGSWTSRRPRS